jgi:hypothetical protein
VAEFQLVESKVSDDKPPLVGAVVARTSIDESLIFKDLQVRLDDLHEATVSGPTLTEPVTATTAPEPRTEDSYYLVLAQEWTRAVVAKCESVPGLIDELLKHKFTSHDVIEVFQGRRLRIAMSNGFPYLYRDEHSPAIPLFNLDAPLNPFRLQIEIASDEVAELPPAELDEIEPESPPAAEPTADTPEAPADIPSLIPPTAPAPSVEAA